ncbi:MAG: hypothetical protein LLF76_03065 [Planctomycetaceae bacterium]|nr:hypothetical protein [Planctomycetaceae bacterium]
MSLTKDTPVVQDVSQNRSSVPAAANVTVYEGAMIGDSAGYGRPLVSGDRFRGHAIKKVVNGAVAGEKDIDILHGRYKLEVTLTGVAITDAGKAVYATDDATHTLTPGGTLVGRVVRYVAANTALVEFDTGAQTTALLVSNVALGTELGASSTDVFDFDPAGVLDGARIRAGDVLKVRAVIAHSGSQTGATLTIKLLVGTEEIVSTGALTIAAQNDQAVIDAVIVFNTAGIQVGKIAATVLTVTKLNTTVAVNPVVKAEATEDLRGAAIPIKLTGQYNGSNANNKARVVQLTAEYLPAPQA